MLAVNDLPSSPPPEPPGPRLHPVAIALLLILIVGGWILVGFAVPVLLVPLPFAIPLLGGTLAAWGQGPEVRRRRFWTGFLTTLGVELVAGVIFVGICVAALNSQMGG